MSTPVLLLVGFFIIAAAVYLMVRRVEVRLVLLGAGLLMATVAGDPLTVLDTFTWAMVTAMVAPICAAMGFAAVLSATGCDRHLVQLLVAPLRRFRWLVVPGGILAAYVVNTAVTSMTSTAAALGPILIPLMMRAGVRLDVAGAALILGSSFGGDLLNPGAQDVQALASTAHIAAKDISLRVVRAMLIGTLLAAAVGWREIQQLARSLFEGMGSAYGNIISLTITAQCFGAGIAAIGISSALLGLLSISPFFAPFFAAAVPWGLAVLSGSGSGSILAFGQSFLARVDAQHDVATLCAVACLAGDEVTKANAQREGLELATLLGIPVYETLRTAFHNFPRHHSLFAGQVLLSGKDVSVRDFLKGRDRVINIGENDLGDIDPRDAELVPVRPFYESGTKVVRIGLNTNALGRNNPFSAAIVASAKLTLRALIDAVTSRITKERIARIRAARWSGDIRPVPQIEPARLGNYPIHPDELGWALEQELDPDAIVVSENLTGSNHFLRTGFRQNEKMWVSNSASGLGWGVGAATGAKLAAPDRQVVCNIGDGSMMYSAGGLWTQARYAIPVLTVVCNNRNYQSVRRAYHRYDSKMAKANRYPGMYLGDPDIDFVKLASSQGIEGVRVEQSADLRRGLQRGIAATRRGSPFVVEVVVQRTGGGADSTWHELFSLAKMRRREV